MKNQSWLWLLTALAIISTACGQPGFQVASLNSVGDLTNSDSTIDGVPSCVVDLPQATLSGNVNAFEMANSIGITIGYNPNGSHAVSGSANVKIDTAKMDMSLFTIDPLSGVIIGSTTVDPKQTNTKVGVNIDFNLIGISPELFFDTPLAKVTFTGLTKGVSNLQSQMATTPWMGRALKAKSDSIIINSGAAAGLMPGDVFDVFNVEHDWSGAPCASTHLGSFRSSALPTATIEISQVGVASSYGSVIASNGDVVRPGAEVQVRELVVENGKSRALKKKLSVTGVTARKLDLPGGKKFDLEHAMSGQIRDVVSKSGFWMGN